jgi:hypothetical protein
MVEERWSSWFLLDLAWFYTEPPIDPLARERACLSMYIRKTGGGCDQGLGWPVRRLLEPYRSMPSFDAWIPSAFAESVLVQVASGSGRKRLSFPVHQPVTIN